MSRVRFDVMSAAAAAIVLCGCPSTPPPAPTPTPSASSSVHPDIPCTTCGGVTGGGGGTSGGGGGSAGGGDGTTTPPAAVFCPQGGGTGFGTPLSLFTISWHHAAPANQPPTQTQVKQAADEFHALFPNLNPADLIVAVPASPYSNSFPSWEGSSVFKDEMNSLYHTSLSEQADDSSIDPNSLANHRNVGALVWGTNWQLVQNATLIPYQTSDFCGVPSAQVEGLFFGDYQVMRVNDSNVQFHVILLQTDSSHECVRVNQINRATAYALAHSPPNSIPAFIIGDVNNENPASTQLASKTKDLLNGTMCDEAKDWTATSPAYPDMNMYEIAAAGTTGGPHVSSIATVLDANNSLRTAHFTLPPIRHSVAGVQMTLALPVPPPPNACNDPECKGQANSCYCVRTKTCLSSRMQCTVIH